MKREVTFTRHLRLPVVVWMRFGDKVFMVHRPVGHQVSIGVRSYDHLEASVESVWLTLTLQMFGHSSQELQASRLNCS